MNSRALVACLVLALVPLAAHASSNSFKSYFGIEFESAIPDQNVVDNPHQVRMFFRYIEANGGIEPYWDGMRTAFSINKRCMDDHSATIDRLAEESAKMHIRCANILNGKHPNMKRFHVCLAKANEWNKHAPYPCQKTSHQLSTITKSFRAEVRAMWVAWERVKGASKRDGIYPY